MTNQSQALALLLDAARRRHLSQLIVDQAVIALSAAFGGAVLLLLVGTQILEWYWLAVLFAASFGVGIWRTLRRIPSRYRLAQRIDSRLALKDTLSTAFAFQSGRRKAPPELVGYQTGQAETIAGTIDVSRVFPLHLPKAMYAAGGVALVAFGMFALRYGVTRSLDLKPSLVKIAFDTFWKQTPAPEKKSDLQRVIEDQLKKLGVNVNVPDAPPKPQDVAEASTQNTADGPDVRNAEAADNAQVKEFSSSKDEIPGEGDENGERASGTEAPNQGDAPQDAAQAAENRKNQPKDEKSSLLDRMRDAMNNLLNKMKMQPEGAQSRQQNAKDSKKGSPGEQAQKGGPTPGKPQSNGEPQDQQGDPKQNQGEHAQNAQGKTGDKGPREPSNDSKSGVGKDDGDKTAREAEQLAAMGKITEILGKRAQNMTGELMVEVAGGNQSLKTDYSSTTGKHAEAGGEINRDEVPLIYRDFVQQYFEQVRRTPPPGAAKKTTKVSE